MRIYVIVLFIYGNERVYYAAHSQIFVSAALFYQAHCTDRIPKFLQISV